MNTVTFTLREEPELYLEVEEMTPDACAGKGPAEISAMPVFMGNQTLSFGDFFDITGKGGATAADTKLVVNGDLRKIKYIGMKMTGGEVVVNGSTDMYTGAWMEGGTITVNGSVDSFAGIGMKGGSLIINGDARDYLGAAYRGDWRGMQGGTITVKGDVGSDTGMFMNGGTIDIGGNVDFHVGVHADGGKIIVRGNSKGRVGGQMVKGDIIVLGEIERMMPTFALAGETEIEIDGKQIPVQVWNGDMGERHGKRKGEVIYGKLYLKIKKDEAVAKTERRGKATLTDEQKAEIAVLLEATPGMSQTVLRSRIKDMFGADLKKTQVANLVRELVPEPVEEPVEEPVVASQE